ncbi:MAG TPA: hypothetical protein VJ898_02310 [Natrialbaceae archaeon]|jgi:hypothetical protein|nr:hypothetical protein [Natrialbaceae archaeon]
MSVRGLCQICEREEATHRCDRCGTFVCDEHFDETTGYCTDCMRLVRGEGKPEDVFKF